MTGSFTLDENGQAVVEVEIAENSDDDDDALESISFFITNTPAFADAFILGASDSLGNDPVWSVTSDVNYLREGETVTFTVGALNIPDGTNFKYKLDGPLTRSDIVGARLESSVDVDANPLQIIDGQCIIPIQIAEDGLTEDEEQFDFVLVSYVDENGDDQDIVDVSTTVVIASEVLIDSSVTPTYSVTSDKFTYKEGETITYTITTTNIANGTLLQYTLYGNGISKDDFDGNSLFGTFTIIDNQAKVYVGIADDRVFESTETLTFLVNGTGAFADVLIFDESDRDDDPDPVTPRKPCFDKPIAGKPITDSNGAIISIPIVEQGCPYVFPPKVIITGPGYGASGIPLLDATGKVSEIRVTRTGRGYNLNKDPELRCVIDSYTIISPGQGYTSTPDVYVDGVAGRAIAVIDERGYLISVQPTDRTSTWNEIPVVRIIGGGGSGARVLPSISCLDTKTYEDQGYAKIGTGKYIDCP